jgi:hypothetical protein
MKNMSKEKSIESGQAVYAFIVDKELEYTKIIVQNKGPLLPFRIPKEIQPFVHERPGVRGSYFVGFRVDRILSQKELEEMNIEKMFDYFRDETFYATYLTSP